MVNNLILGDCVEVMKGMDRHSIDCICTDPPYGIAFMGKDWDKALPRQEAFKQMHRILKPGGIAFVMSSPRQDVLWRMLRLLENSGFELKQSFVSWVYKCVSEDTEVLTKDGWEQFNKSKTFLTKEILTYNIENDTYEWEVPYKWSSYNIKDTCYRIKSDYTDQLVTRGHRIPIEQEGKVLYKFVEELTKESKILYLEDLSRVQEVILNSRSTRKKRIKLLQQKMQWNKQKEGTNEVHFRQSRNYEKMLENKEREKEKEEIQKENVRSKKSFLEGRNNILQGSRKLQGNKVCTLSKEIHRNGKERWLCNGTQISSSPTVRKMSKKNRSSSSLRSQSRKQYFGESDIIQKQQGSQVTRTWASYKTTMAVITKEYYEGLVYCPSVSTNLFVARRKGKIFITGNTGFPKAYDVSKGIDKKLGIKRKVIGGTKKPLKYSGKFDQRSSKERIKDLPSSDLAKQWEGWKSITGLKPALECILMVNKPLSEPTIVDNVLKHGIGAINVDGCRIPFKSEKDKQMSKVDFSKSVPLSPKKGWNENSMVKLEQKFNKGRFPANLLVSDKAIDSGKITGAGITGSGKVTQENRGEYLPHNVYGDRKVIHKNISYNDIGDQSRYFDLDAWWNRQCIILDVPKPSKSERDKGCNNLEGKVRFGPESSSGKMLPSKKENIESHKIKGNFHPTVKPIKLMAYLIQLGCQPDGIVLDPFVGSGTTCIAAKMLNRKWIGIEVNREYINIASARLGNCPIVEFKPSKQNIVKSTKEEKKEDWKNMFEVDK